MNEQYRLNKELIRARMNKEHRKKTWLISNLDVSDATATRILKGIVPCEETLKNLAALLGVKESDLLLPKEEAA